MAGFSAQAGQGVAGRVAGRRVLAGQAGFLESAGLLVPAGLRAEAERLAGGRTVILVGWDGAARGAVAVADTIKPDAARVIAWPGCRWAWRRSC